MICALRSVDAIIIMIGLLLGQFYYNSNVDSTLIYDFLCITLFIACSLWPLFWSIPLQYCQPISLPMLRLAKRRSRMLSPDGASSFRPTDCVCACGCSAGGS